MKSILQALFSNWYRNSSRVSRSSTKSSLNSSSSLFEKRGDNSFFTAFISNFLFSIFGGIQKECSSFLGLTKVSQRQYFKSNAISVLSLSFLFVLGIQFTSSAQTITPGSSYTQNFNAIGTAAAATLPAGWKAENITGARNITNAYTAVTGTTTPLALAFSTAMGSTAGNGIYNFGGGAVTGDQAIGGISSGSASQTVNMYLKLTNSSATTSIPSFTISYKAERYRNGTNAAGYSIRLYYSTTGAAASWTEIPSGILSFTANADNNGSTTNPLETKTATSIALAQSLAASGSIYFAWSYSVTSGTTTSNAQALAIDDITIADATAAATPTITGAATALAFSTTYGTASTAQTFSVSGANLTADLVATAPTGFEVASDGATYGATATFTRSGSTASGTLSLRLAATAAAGGAYNGKTIALTSTGATAVNITTAASGNTVATKALTISGVAGVSKTYDRTVTATLSGTAVYNGLVNGETLSVTGTPSAVFADKNFGIAKAITVTGYTAPSSNYTVSQPTGLTADITAKDLTVSNVTANNKTYDGTVSATILATLNGVIAPDSVTLLVSGEFENNFQTIFFATPANIVNLAFSLNGSADSANYNLVQPTVNGLTADIFPKELTVSNAIASDKEYDGTTDAVVTGTLNGVVSGDTVVLISSGVFASAEVGANIAVTPTWSIDGDTFNYTLTNPTVSLTANITSAGSPIVTSATSASATYGDTTTSYFITASGDATSYNATGLPAGLSVNTATGEISGSPTLAGIYTVSISATNSGGTGFATLTYTINAINLTIPDAIANNKQYDGTTSATITGTLTGAIAGDDVSFSGVGTFDTAAVGSNIFVTSNVLLTGTKASNYTLTQPSGLTASILQKVLTVSALVTDKVYNGTTAASVTVNTVTGIVGSEVVNVTGTGIFDTALVGNSKSVTVSYSLNGANAANYSVVSPVTLTGNITPKALTFTATADSKVFDGNTNATVTVSAITGVVSPDVVTITGTGTFASSDIANGIVVSNVVLTLGGAQAANYSISQPGDLVANITAAPTVLTAGDIAVIGYNSNANPDSFAILVLKDLTSGTQFFVNDNELASTTATAFTDLGEMEASFTVKSGQTIPAGTVIVLPWGTTAVSTATYDWSATTSAGLNNGPNDEIYIYTAPAITSATPTSFIYFAKLGTSTSSIPSSLETSTTGTGTTAISPTAVATRYNTTTNIYNSCKQILLNEIGKTATANWTTTGATTIAATDWTFTVLPTCPSPTISTNIATLPALTTEYGSASATTSFTVTGSYLTNSVSLTAPAGFEFSTNGVTGFASALTLTQVSGAVNATIFVRLTASTTVLASPYSGNITISTAGTTDILVATTASTVTTKTVTISGLLVNNRVQSVGDFSATLTGTPVLNGVLSADTSNVTLDSSAVSAVFAQDTAGTNIPVTVTGYALTGTVAGNYSLVQPSLTGTLTSVASPVITSALTFSAVYGTLANDYTITATSAEAAPITGYNATGLPAGLSIDTVTGVISGTPTAAAGTYNITISATNLGGTTNALLVYTVTKKEITVSATASNKVYNATTAAAITVNSITGVVGADVVTVTGAGTFDSKNIGTAKPVTAALVLGGAQAGNYSLTQPSGLTADITAFTLTLSGAAAQSKVFDGNTNAVITAALVGIISGDVVTFNGTGTFASSAIGQAIAVTSTATLTGADAGNYTFVQPTTLTANITDTIIYSNIFTGTAACPTQGNTPSMVTNATGTSLSRSTIACTTAANVFNSTTLNATAAISNTSYIEFTASATAGNKLSVSSMSFFRQASGTAPNKLEVRYSTDGFVTSTTWGSAPNTPTSGTVATWDFSDFTTPTSGTVTFRIYPYGTTRADLTGTAAAGTGTFRLDDVTIYGKVLTGPTAATLSLTGNDTFCSGSSTTVKVDITGGTAPYTVAYSNGSTTSYISGADATIIPTSSTLTLVSVTDANGITLNTNLTGAINFNITASTSNTTTATSCDSYTWSVNGQTYTTSGTYSVVTGCHTEVLNLTITPSTSNTTTAASCDTYVWSVNGQTYNTSGTYSVVSGCHTEVLNLTITPTTSNTTTATSCDTYTWSVNNQEYNVSGTYSVISGCHTEVLNLTITPSTSNTTTTSACDSYTWSVNDQEYTASGVYTFVNGCHTEVLNLTITPSTSHTTTVNSCDVYTWSYNDQQYATSGVYTVITGCHTEILNLTVSACSSVVTVNMNIEGYYDATAHAMRPVLMNQGSGTSSTDVDTVTVELHDVTSYATVETTTAMLQTNGSAVATFTSRSGSFYIVVKHRNSLETWSANPVTVGATASYNFTDSASKAYGNNMKMLETGVYGFYSGDINQDGFIELSDFAPLFNDNDAAAEGYLTTDLNGDGFVESQDYPILINNSDAAVELARP